MRAQKCKIRECGAVVLMVPVETGEIAVDPQPIEVAVLQPDGRFLLQTGYRPHWMTCADIVARGHSSLHPH